MKTRIIKIGNSQGIRIPKLLLEQSRLGEEVELEVRDSQIVIRPAGSRPRQGCEEAFRAMSERGDDRLLDDDLKDQENATSLAEIPTLRQEIARLSIIIEELEQRLPDPDEGFELRPEIKERSLKSLDTPGLEEIAQDTHRLVLMMSQSYYWTPEWQAKERRADEDEALGRSKVFESADDLIAELNS